MGAKSKPTEYEWLGDLLPTSQLTARDICQIYKLNSTAFYQRINRGTFPAHDKVGQHNEKLPEIIILKNENADHLDGILNYFKTEAKNP